MFSRDAYCGLALQFWLYECPNEHELEVVRSGVAVGYEIVRIEQGNCEHLD
jgi:hypothetical protein